MAAINVAAINVALRGRVEWNLPLDVGLATALGLSKGVGLNEQIACLHIVKMNVVVTCGSI